MPDQPKFPGRPGDWVLYKDNQLIAFNKPAGMPAVPDKKGSPNLLQVAAAYTRHDLFPIHRLDRPVSGVILFGKKPAAQAQVTEQFQARTIEKTYLAIVGERPEQDEDILVHFLREAKGNNAEIVDSSDKTAKRAELRYRYLGSSDRYHLLEVVLVTGRKHQIRAQLGAIGSPIRGDEKYGFKRGNPDRTIDLHAYTLAFDHPISGSRVELQAPLPEEPVWEAFSSLLTSRS
ncbi:23S rRNA pseudouridine1911/1915/1917 synthase [Neolewinella xylanilytica]|uniref:23S rRNA pseudouridine1911/1915/1917 synthase n=1 Tax=Neolewinella xylanilytica TaxID=1514080 RepID=A0A2S6I6N9_9BACT|nr:RluA family pseudouridine synthase [Neolewinella xylanilytica]PPK87176.1 23S rRNA pseudouridine1911/1915/1917 synthase [Neolewinella xylanilytica]